MKKKRDAKIIQRSLFIWFEIYEIYE